jgi:hypothetical protein
MRRRRVLLTAAVVVGVGVLVGGCSRPAAEPGVAYARYGYSCCQPRPPEVAHPGQVIALHWTATAQPPTPAATATPVTLSAWLTGPFPDVAALKTAMTATSLPAAAVTAAAVHTTDRAGGTPVSTLPLPASAPAGFYDLRTSVVFGGGALSGDTVVRVSAASAGG